MLVKQYEFYLLELTMQVYNNHIIRYLEESSDSVSLLRDGDKLVAYRLPKQYEKSSLVVFTHKHFVK
jgi:ubiquitin carboxyl-terminal hydrolase 4/11/15